MSQVEKKNDILKQTEQSYGNVVYDSHPFFQTHPAKMSAIAKIFGMHDAPPINKARVLELGCAAGGNIIPHAANFPDAKFCGIDLSKVQIDQGNEIIKSANLKNITLEHKNIMDIDKNYGEFDYIITHGIYSWVPGEVSDKILWISKNLLSKNGMAYISYNTMPGWSQPNTIRDMLLYHTEDIKEGKEKIGQAKAFLNFMKDLSKKDKESGHPYSMQLHNEISGLLEHRGSYIFHEYMESCNRQFYFHEFISDAKKHDLCYLGESDLNSMNISNMNDIVQKHIKNTGIIETEQYMDFATNRRFRKTILCHKDIKLNRNLSIESMKDTIREFSFQMDLSTESDDNAMTNDNEVTFYIDGDKERILKSKSPYWKQVFNLFAKNKNRFIKFTDILKTAITNKDETHSQSQITKEITGLFCDFIIKGTAKFLDLECEIDIPIMKTASYEKPKLWKLAIEYAKSKHQNHIPTKIHTFKKVDHVAKAILSLCDGTNTIDEITKKTTLQFQNGTLKLFNAKGERIPMQEIDKNLSNWILGLVQNCDVDGILE